MQSKDLPEAPLGRRILEHLRDHPGEHFDTGQMVAAMGLGDSEDGEARNTISMLVSTRMNRAGKRSAWRYVRRVSKGVYTYVEAEPEEEPTWSQVATDTSGALVLRSPEGRLYVARPLSN